MSLLSVVQYFYRRTNIQGSVPDAVISSSDPQVRQIYALLEEEGNDLSGRGDWQELTFEATHTSVATESQGAIDTIATNGFRYIKEDTFWDRTESLPILPISGSEWQAEKGFAATSPRYRVRIRGGNLLANPTPAAGNTWAFEYISWNWITDSGGSTYKQYFTADTDLILLPEPIVLMGLRWRWKKEKGLDYAEDFQTYEMMVKNELGRQDVPRKLSMDMTEKETVPGVVVPQGSWVL